jgi:hypothetical protein
MSAGTRRFSIDEGCSLLPMWHLVGIYFRKGELKSVSLWLKGGRAKCLASALEFFIRHQFIHENRVLMA